MTRVPVIALAAFALATLYGCSSKPQAKPTVALAASAADAARQSWDRPVPPVSIVVEDMPSGIDSLGVSFVCTDRMSGARDTLPCEPFSFSKGRFLPSSRDFHMTDTAAVAYAYWPVSRSSSRKEVFSAPFSDHLYSRALARDTDSVTTRRFLFEDRVALVSSMAVLQIRTASLEIGDILDGIRISSPDLYSAGSYDRFSGEWSDLRRGYEASVLSKGCLLNNGRLHNIYLVPSETESAVGLFLTINGVEYMTRLTLSPIAPGSLVRLNVTKGVTDIAITGSWYDQQRRIEITSPFSPDTVRVGNFLRADGSIVTTRDSLCVACVISTDGRHGRAVALHDAGEYRFPSFRGVPAQHFATADGIRIQGKINPKSSESVPAGMSIALLPGKELPEGCALSDLDGLGRTSSMLSVHFRSATDDKASSMMSAVDQHPGSYVPSLGELAALYLDLNPLSGPPKEYPVSPLSGCYISSSDSGEDTFYTLDFSQGLINGTSSKSYTAASLRLFYKF